jgi:hypothetical protein
MIAVSARRSGERDRPMKEVIVIFLFALVLSSLVGSLDTSLQPYPWPVGITDIKQSALGVGKRDDSSIGEVNYTDGKRSEFFMTQIDEKSTERNIGFPLGANN